jgi:hypothetical protein
VKDILWCNAFKFLFSFHFRNRFKIFLVLPLPLDWWKILIRKKERKLIIKFHCWWQLCQLGIRTDTVSNHSLSFSVWYWKKEILHYGLTFLFNLKKLWSIYKLKNNIFLKYLSFVIGPTCKQTLKKTET